MSKISEKIRLGIILPLAEKIKGTKATYWYRKIQEMQSWSKAEIYDWQESQMRAFIQHAYQHTIYYRNLFDSLGLKPEDIQHMEDLKKIPIVTKEIVNAHYEEFVPNNIASIPYRKGRTGGTSGKPMLYLYDENTWGYVTAAKIFYWKKAGWMYGEKFAAFGSASLFGKKPSLVRRIYDRIRNEVPMNSVNLDDELCAKYIGIISKQHIRFIYGYAASIFILAQYVKKNKVHMDEIKAIFTTSENLTDEYRKVIETAFKTKVVDCYGASDAGITGYETAYHQYEVGYNAIVEIEDKIDEHTGTALTTNFLNYSFPLIRYSFGDVVELAEKSEYNGQMLTKILGRTHDVMRLSNGRNLTATGFSMIMKEFDVVAFDVNKVGENAVKMRIQKVNDKYTDEQEKRIVKTLRMYVGDDCDLQLEYVDHFEELKNGKRRYFMNANVKL